MAENTSKYAETELVSLYCYVDKGTGAVKAIISFNLFGTAIREDNDWKFTPRTSEELVEYLNGDYDVWKIDWEKEPIIDADPKDFEAAEHQLVKAWDSGESITEEDLQKYARKLETVFEDRIDQE